MNEKNNYPIFAGILFIALVFSGQFISLDKSGLTKTKNLSDDELAELIIPVDGVVLPVKWLNLGKQMVDAGVIDFYKLEEIYKQRGGLTDEERKFLFAEDNQEIKIDRKNASLWLNLFWALGLGNKNEILENGPMRKYGNTENFSSTGGWTIAKSDAMDHYGKHLFISLTPEQQKLVERLSKNIYRPCCDNPTHFPDCNHGMAMLGFLELMAAQGVAEKEMYRFALILNSYWFSDAYLTIAKYLQQKGVYWDKINPEQILGKDFSSVSGYSRILKYVAPPENSKNSCAV